MDGIEIQRGSVAQSIPSIPTITNVKDFGAVGDGIVDDTAAIQSALDSLPSNGGVVYFPNGNYIVSSVLTVGKACTRLLGLGRRQRIATLAPSLITYTGTGNVFNVTGAQGFVMEYLHVSYPAQSGTVVNVSNVASGYIRNCHFVGTSKNGNAIVIDDGSGWTFKDVDIEYFNIAIDLKQNNGDTLLDNVAITLCNTGTRIGVTSSVVGVTITGADFELNGNAIEVIAGYSVHIFGCYFEQETSGSYILKLSGDASHTPTNISIKGCYSNGSSVANYMIYVDRVAGLEVSDMLTINYISGLINNNHTSSSGIEIRRCNNISPSSTAQINDLTGVVYYEKNGRIGIGPVSPSNMIHLKTNGSDLPRVRNETSTRTWLYGVDTSPDEFFLNDVTAGTIPFRIAGSTGIITSLPTYSNTTATAANVNVDSSGLLKRSTSSLRYKKDIEDYKKGLFEVLAMRPVSYKSNDVTDEKQYAGLIAEEIDAIGLSEFVEYNKEGSPDALYYQNMVALLINSIKELNQKITKLEKKK